MGQDYISPSIYSFFDTSNAGELETLAMIKENCEFYYNDDGAADELWDAFAEYGFYGVPKYDGYNEKNVAFAIAEKSYKESIKNFFKFLKSNNFEKNKFFSGNKNDRKQIFLDFMCSEKNAESEVINRYHNIMLTIFDQLLQVFHSLGDLMLRQGESVEFFTDLSQQVTKELDDEDVKLKKTVILADDESDQSRLDEKADIDFHNNRVSERQTAIDAARSTMDRYRDSKSTQLDQTMNSRNDQMQILSSLINKFESLIQSIIR